MMLGRVLRGANTEFRTAVARVRAKLRRGSTATKMRGTRLLDLAQLEERLLLSAAPAGSAAVPTEPLGTEGSPISVSHEQAASAENTGRESLNHDDSIRADFAQDPRFSSDPAELQGRDRSGKLRSQQRQQLLFIDPQVQDSELLMASLQSLRHSARHVDVVYLDSHRDGIVQVSEVLATYTELDAVHFVSHASSGVVQLGGVRLDSAGLERYSDSIASWREALAGDADLLFYGCNLSSGAPGQMMLRDIAELTGADVAGSNDDTGQSALGGDWALEFATGHIESDRLLGRQARTTWQGLLAIPAVAPANILPLGEQREAVVATDAAGNFVIVWSSDQAGSNDIYARRYDASGTPLGIEFRVNTTTSGDQSDPAVSMDDDGNFVVVWTTFGQNGDDANEGNIYARQFDASGTALGGEFRVNDTHSGDQRDASVALDKSGTTGNFLISWASYGQDSSGWGVYAHTFDADADDLSGDVQVSTVTTGDQTSPDVASDGLGNFVVAWASDGVDGDGSGIFYQFFNDNGSKQNSNSQVNTTTLGDQINPAVAMDDQGACMFVWMSPDADGWGVYGQYLNAAGTAKGPELLINTTTDGNQTAADVSMDLSGNFVVTWSSSGQDGDGTTETNIYGRLFHKTSQGPDPQTGEFLVNTETAGSQQSPAVAATDMGGFVVTWSGQGTLDPDGVFYRVFDNGLGNQAPTVALANSSVMYVEDAPPLVIDPALFVTDADDTELSGAYVSITAGFVIGQDVLAFTDQSGITGNYDATTGVLTLAGTASVSDYQTALRSVTYQNTSSNPDTSRRTIEVGVTDSLEFGADSRQLDIASVNDSPVVAVPGTQVTPEDVGIVFSTANGNAISVDDLDVGGGLIKVHLKSINGLLTLATTAGLVTDSSEGMADSTITIKGTLAALNAALDGLRFDPTPGFSGSAIIDITVYDQGNSGAGGPKISAAAVDIVVTPVNSAPAITALSGDGLSYAAGIGAQGIEQSGDAVVSDSDSLEFGGGNLTVSITAGGAVLEDVLAVGDMGTAPGQISVSGLLVLYNFGAGPVVIGTVAGGVASSDLVVTFSSDATPTAVTALVRAITYENVAASNPTIGTRTVIFTISDGDGATSTNYDTTVTVNVGNTPPAIANLARDSLAYFEGDGAVVVEQDDDAIVSDADSANFSGGNLTITIVAGGDASQDILSIRNEGTAAGQIGYSAGNVTFGGVVIGTASVGGSNSSLIVSFNANATSSAVTALVRNITFENSDGDNPTAGARTIRFTVDDGEGGTSSTNDAKVYVNAINDAPQLTLSGNAITYNEGDPPTVIDPGVTVDDVDSPDFDGGLVRAGFTVAGTQHDRLIIRDEGIGVGHITVVGTIVRYDFGAGPTVIGQFSGGTSGFDPLIIALNANADLAALQALLRNVSYGNVSNDPSTAARTVRFVLTDGDGGTSSAVHATIHVAALNDAPYARDDFFSTDNNLSLMLAASGVLRNDREPEGDILTAVLVAGPAHGVLSLNVDGSFEYTPDSRFSGVDRFTYQATDGVDSSSVATVTIDVRRFVPPSGGELPDPEVNPEPPETEPGSSPEPKDSPPQAVPATPPFVSGDGASNNFSTGSHASRALPVREQSVTSAETRGSALRFQSLSVQLSESWSSDRSRRDEGRFARPEGLASAISGNAFDVGWIVTGEALWGDLDLLKSAMAVDGDLPSGVVVGSIVTSSLGMSLGYILWVLRSGYLLSSLLASMPAWRFIDPLPVLDYVGDETNHEEQDDESLQSLIEKMNTESVSNA